MWELGGNHAYHIYCSPFVVPTDLALKCVGGTFSLLLNQQFQSPTYKSQHNNPGCLKLLDQQKSLQHMRDASLQRVRWLTESRILDILTFFDLWTF